MNMDTITPQAHLDWAVERALQLYDQGEQKQAVLSFLSDVGKNNRTKHIQLDPFSANKLLEAAPKGHEAFEVALTSFAL
jgi:hypothetical protein